MKCMHKYMYQCRAAWWMAAVATPGTRWYVWLAMAKLLIKSTLNQAYDACHTSHKAYMKQWEFKRSISSRSLLGMYAHLPCI